VGVNRLTIRRATEKDHPWLEEQGLDPRGFKSPSAHTFICEEKGKRVGAAMGNEGGGDVCVLRWVHSVLPDRLDILWALIERHIQNGLDTGHKKAVVNIPNRGQCTNMETSALLDCVRADTSVSLRDAGWNVKEKRVEGTQVDADLETEKGNYARALDEMGCAREWV